MFPWEYGLWATKNEGVGLIVRAIIVSKITNLCGHDTPPTSQTDRCHASRGKNAIQL